MRWSPSPDEPGVWRGERWFVKKLQHLASVEKSDSAPLLPMVGVAYSAEVVCDGSPQGFEQWRSAPMLFASLKEAQLWCESEVRMMEIKELA